MINVGKKAPAFTLLNQNDEKVSLKDFTGKWLVLYFYPKDNTSGCTREAEDFTDTVKQLKKINAAVVGVSPDSTESHRKFIEKYKLGITLLSDENKKVMKKYGAWGLKKNYGKEYEGVIRSTFLISPAGIISEIWQKVKVRVKQKNGEIKHSEKVLERLINLT